MKEKTMCLLGVAMLFVVFGCGDSESEPAKSVCEQAQDICGGSGSGGGSAECSGLTECVSQCVVDNDSCTSPETAGCAVDCNQ